MEDETIFDIHALTQLEDMIFNSPETNLLAKVVYGTDATFSEFDEDGIAYLVGADGGQLPLVVFGTFCGVSEGTKMGAAGTFEPENHRDVLTDAHDVTWKFALNFPDEAHIHSLARLYIRQIVNIDDLIAGHWLSCRNVYEKDREAGKETRRLKLPFNNIRGKMYDTESGGMYPFSMETARIYRVPSSLQDKGFRREGKVGELYNPDRLMDHKGPLFTQENARLVQLDIRDDSSELVKPWNMHWTFRPGTLVMAEVFLVCERGTEYPNEIHLEYSMAMRKMKRFAASLGQPEHVFVPILPAEEMPVVGPY